jgi:hypothetical protein
MSGVGDIVAGGGLAVSAEGATAKLPRELFTTFCGAGRCGAWAQAANASRVKARSERGKRLVGGVAKFRTL